MRFLASLRMTALAYRAPRPAPRLNGCGTHRAHGVLFRRMRFHTYTKFSPELADAIDLQALLDKLADFLLQSGFAGDANQPYYGFDMGDEGNRSLDALKQAILDALLESGQ